MIKRKKAVILAALATAVILAPLAGFAFLCKRLVAGCLGKVIGFTPKSGGLPAAGTDENLVSVCPDDAGAIDNTAGTVGKAPGGGTSVSEDFAAWALIYDELFDDELYDGDEAEPGPDGRLRCDFTKDGKVRQSDSRPWSQSFEINALGID